MEGSSQIVRLAIYLKHFKRVNEIFSRMEISPFLKEILKKYEDLHSFNTYFLIIALNWN